MGKAILAGLLSGLVMPGLGHLVIRRFKRGGLIIAGMSGLVIALSIALFLNVRRAILAFGDDLPPENERWAALAQKLSDQDQTVILVIGVIMAGLWLFALIDSVRLGIKAAGEETID